MHCPSCGRVMTEANLFAAEGYARCGGCGTLHRLAPEPPGGWSQSPAPREELAFPRQLQVEQEEGRLLIRWRWQRIGAVATLPFGVLSAAVSATLLFSGVHALREGQPGAVPFLFSGMFVAIITAFIWRVSLAALLNWTTVRADATGLSITHRPIRAAKEWELKREEIAQLYASMVARRSRRYRSSADTTHECELMAVTVSGQHRLLLSRLPSAHHALFLEQRIERALGVEDTAVEGELAPRSRLATAEEARAAARNEVRRYERRRVPRPARLRVEEGDGRFTVSWRWLRNEHLAFLCVPFMLVVVRSMIVLAEGLERYRPQGVDVLVLASAWLCAAYLLNRTWVEVSGQTLRVRHGPIPWPGASELPRAELAQLFGRVAGSFKSSGRGREWIWELAAVDRAGKTRSLAGRLRERGEVLWLEQELEAHLDLVDAPVPHEAAADYRHERSG